MIRVWLVSCGILFLGVELLQWAQEWAIPLPFYIIGGAILAIASNTDKGMTQWQSPQAKSTLPPSAPTILPTPTKETAGPISFTIKQTEPSEEW